MGTSLFDHAALLLGFRELFDSKVDAVSEGLIRQDRDGEADRG